MIPFIAKLIPWLIIGYALWGSFTIYQGNKEEYDDLINIGNLLEQKIEKKKAEVESIGKYSKNKKQLNARLEKAKTELEKINKNLPKEINDAEIFSYLNKLALGVLIKNPILEQVGENEHELYTEKRYRLRAQANFLQFILLFKEIFSSQRLFNIKNFKLTKTEHKQYRRHEILQGEILLESYKQK